MVDGYLPIIATSDVYNFPSMNPNNWNNIWFWRAASTYNTVDSRNPGSFWLENTGGIGSEEWVFDIVIAGPKQRNATMCLDCRYATSMTESSSYEIQKILSQLPEYVVLNPSY